MNNKYLFLFSSQATKIFLNSIFLTLFCFVFINASIAKNYHFSQIFYHLSDTSQKPIPDISAQACEGLDKELLFVDKASLLRDSLVDFAKKFLKTPYCWGGTTASGFDCSGYAQYVYQHFGYSLARVSGWQVQSGKAVKPEKARKGDLVFYGYPYRGGYIYTHTAMVYANDEKGVRIIHSILSGVSITNLHFDLSWRTRFICIRSLLD